MRVFKRIYNGARNLEGGGSHPGNDVMVLLFIIAACFGVQKALEIGDGSVATVALYVGIFVSAIIVGVGPIWLIGAYDRGKSYEMTQNKHKDQQQ